jgi:hypothetical protein
VSVHPSTRRQLYDHLGQAEFSLKVAKNFECLAGTPASAAVEVALAEVTRAREWVRTRLAVSHAAGPSPKPMREGLPLTRRERLSFRHLNFP